MKRLEKFQSVLLGIDLGSTHIKIAVFTPSGERLGLAVVENRLRMDEHGWPVFDPQEMWQSSIQAAQLALQGEGGALAGAARARSGHPLRVLGVGITGMAESGLLLERTSGQPLTPILPWFDRRAESLAQSLPGSPAAAHTSEGAARFLLHGVRPTYKCSLAKLLWIKVHAPEKLENAIWLGAPEYIAFRLTGVFATDYSLAGRTGAFRIDELCWDVEWLAALGLPENIFPQALPAGTTLGIIGEYDGSDRGDPTGNTGSVANALRGAQVVIGGHDHVCAALAAGLLNGGVGGGLVYDSLGTAEALVGAFPQRALVERDYRSGFSFGLHVAPGFCYWMGGINASGGSLEWLRGILGEPKISYPELELLLDGAPDAPGDILFLPFLSGRGSPHSDPQARAAFIGLTAAHGRALLARAVMEGVALELACILERVRTELGVSTDILAAAGGGVYNQRWMQIRADVSGCRIQVLPQAEAALLGAAALAGVGCGVYADLDHAAQALRCAGGIEYLPDEEKYAVYERQLEKYRQFVDAIFTS